MKLFSESFFHDFTILRDFFFPATVCLWIPDAIVSESSPASVQRDKIVKPSDSLLFSSTQFVSSADNLLHTVRDPPAMRFQAIRHANWSFGDLISWPGFLWFLLFQRDLEFGNPHKDGIYSRQNDDSARTRGGPAVTPPQLAVSTSEFWCYSFTLPWARDSRESKSQASLPLYGLSFHFAKFCVFCFLSLSIDGPLKGKRSETLKRTDMQF